MLCHHSSYSGSIGTVTASHVYQLVNWYKPEICVTAGATTDCDTLDAIVIKVGDMIWPKLTDTMYMYRVVRFEWTIPLTSTNPLINIILTHAASGNKHYVRQNHPSASASFFWYPHKMLPGVRILTFDKLNNNSNRYLFLLLLLLLFIRAIK